MSKQGKDAQREKSSAAVVCWKVCTCEGLLDAIRSGLKDLKQEEAPRFVVEDYVQDMMHGG